jgi:NAD(P)-dependent dehydrogenase (short-subunit alcohol dehydrogenase family)
MTHAELQLEGKVAFITAGANGLGKACARRLAQFGADIAIADIDVEGGERLVDLLGQMGRRALFLPLNVLETQQLQDAVLGAAEHFGRLDILVNNAGGVRQNSFLDQNERSWRKHIDMNFVSTLAATHAAAKVMIQGARGGTIINVASSEGMRGAPGYAVYAACKAAMISFTRSMALELSGHGIQVNAVAPDMIPTEGLKDIVAISSASEDMARNRYIPLGRVGEVDEFANVVLFLASPMASYLTGVTIPVDGGTIASSGWNRAPGGGQWTLYHE